jgi:N-methylhydantoinase A
VAGLFSSLGLLFSDLAVTRVAPQRAVLASSHAGELRAAGEMLAREAADELARRHEGGEPPSVELFAGLRYVGQLSTLTLPYDADAPLETLAAAFHAEHRRAYGQSAEEEQVELTMLRARATRRAPTLPFAEIAGQYLEAAEPLSGSRELYFGPVVGRLAAPLVGRRDLAAAPLDGPLVVEEPEATIVVPPGFSAALHPTGSVVLRST